MPLLRMSQSMLCLIMYGMQVPTAGVFTPQALQSCVRANFAANKDASPQQQGALLDKVHSYLWQAY